jgi:hypothetical protein
LRRNVRRGVEPFDPTGRERLDAIVEEASLVPESSEHAAPEEGGLTEFSSPACLMHEASDAYMDYASTDELTTFLNELLETERAGARVTRERARAVGTGPVAEIMRTVRRDEARWCATLAPHLKRGGARPSREVGASGTR